MAIEPPAWGEKLSDGRVRCKKCGNVSQYVATLRHDCIYQNDLVADGGFKPTIYLAGPVQHADDHGVGWRETVTELVNSFETANPLNKYNIPVEDLTIVRDRPPMGDDEVSAAQIIESDKDLIREADAILVGYEDVQMTGTPMEVCWCDEVCPETPIVVWMRDQTTRDELSPWWEHADAFERSLTSALWQLRQRTDVEVGL